VILQGSVIDNYRQSPEHLKNIGLPASLLSSNMYENQKRLVSLLSQSSLRFKIGKTMVRNYL